MNTFGDSYNILILYRLSSLPAPPFLILSYMYFRGKTMFGPSYNTTQSITIHMSTLYVIFISCSSLTPRAILDAEKVLYVRTRVP